MFATEYFDPHSSNSESSDRCNLNVYLGTGKRTPSVTSLNPSSGLIFGRCSQAVATQSKFWNICVLALYVAKSREGRRSHRVSGNDHFTGDVLLIQNFF